MPILESYLSQLPKLQYDPNMTTDERDTVAPATSRDVVVPSSPSPNRLPLEEETELLDESTKLKTSANNLFATAEYTEAIEGYNRAYDKLPTYLDYDLAVLKSNIAACYLKLSEWKDAVESASAALDKLDLVDPLPEAAKPGDGPSQSNGISKAKDASGIVEIDDAIADRQEILTEVSKRSLTDVEKLRIKTLLRRAKGRTEEGGWSSLQGAMEDYQQLSSFSNLSSIDRKTVSKAVREIPPRLERAKTEEMADMMGKLKNLGNGILKPFGLSTDNFQFVKDEKSGGYSMNFNQNPGKS
jgi:tetratricopeptide (TPR) repeat protein